MDNKKTGIVKRIYNRIIWTGYKFVHSHKCTPYIWTFFYTIYNLLIHHNEFGHIYLVDDERKCVYFTVPKAGSTSIYSIFCESVEKDCRNVIDGALGQCVKNGLYRKNLFAKHKTYYKFSFVRNPLTRLVSAYESKYHNDKAEGLRTTGVLCFDTYLCGYIKKDEGFEKFIKKITKLPHCLDNEHFASQYKMLYGKKGCMVDYIGHFETLADDFAPIAEKYGFAKLPSFNKTRKPRDWRDYYTVELAKLVYNKYKKDFEMFGYQKSYEELIDYLQEKDKLQSGNQ